MRGPVFFLVGALAFLCVQSGSALTAKEANSVCALLQDGTKIYSQLECNQYYSCKNGTGTLNTCLNGYYFSKDSEACVPPNEVSCGSNVVNPCENIPDGYFVSVANSCSEFYYCKNQVGTKSSCENGLNFDQKNQACQYQSVFPCSESTGDEETGVINLCSVIPNGIYFGSPSDCKSWQKCQTNGPPLMGNCPGEFLFNVDTQACDYKDNTSCRQLKGNPDLGGTSLEGTPCTKNGEIESDNTCAGYYICTNNKYAYTRCINGLYFNPETNTCLERLKAVNNCDRCQGTKLEFVNQYRDNCTGYAYCKNGKTQSTGICSNGGYFDEVSGACVNDANPKYPVCYLPPDTPATQKPTTTTTTTEKTTTTKPTDPEGSQGNDKPTGSEGSQGSDKENQETDDKTPETEGSQGSDKEGQGTDNKTPETEGSQGSDKEDQGTNDKTQETEGSQGSDKEDQGTNDKTQETEGSQGSDKEDQGTNDKTQETEGSQGSDKEDQGTNDKTQETEGSQGSGKEDQETEGSQGSDKEDQGTNDKTQETEGSQGSGKEDQETDNKTQETEGSQGSDKKDQGTDDKTPETKGSQGSDKEAQETEEKTSDSGASKGSGKTNPKPNKSQKAF